MFIQKIKKGALCFISAILIFLLLPVFATTVYADTDGNELKITNQPDKLVIQLGADWADAKFELKLDSGVFPVPVIANSTGVLTMELGGSKTYTLTLLATDTPLENSEQLNGSQQPQQETEKPEQEEDPIMTPPSERTLSVPPLTLILFLGGLGVIAAGLIISKIIKKRREYYYGDDRNDDDNYDE